MRVWVDSLEGISIEGTIDMKTFFSLVFMFYVNLITQTQFEHCCKVGRQIGLSSKFKWYNLFFLSENESSSFCYHSSFSVHVTCVREKPCCIKSKSCWFNIQTHFRCTRDGRRNMDACTRKPISVTACQIMKEWWRNSLLGYGFNVNKRVPLREGIMAFFFHQRKNHMIVCQSRRFFCFCNYSWYYIQVFMIRVQWMLLVCVCVCASVYLTMAQTWARLNYQPLSRHWLQIHVSWLEDSQCFLSPSLFLFFSHISSLCLPLSLSLTLSLCLSQTHTHVFTFWSAFFLGRDKNLHIKKIISCHDMNYSAFTL